MENERGPNIGGCKDGWRTRGDLTLTGDVRGWLENERGPNINSWMYEDGWRTTRGDLTLTGGCTRMVGEREGT